MPENRTPAPAQHTPTAYGWCSWHQGYSGGVRLIQVVEQGSGPGGHVFACASCRELHGLVPFADQP
ncbi:hypothetical protein ACFSL4_17775 [Streptomyces caeni]|uniref:Uncharacterized protein n=1 Tax=Streptomyces caeni TaxID=2307231 RepID=A0ABW4ITW4_9ACTN